MLRRSRPLMLLVRKGGRNKDLPPSLERFHRTSLVRGLFSFPAILILRVFYSLNAVDFLVRSLLNECTGCSWHALNLHAFLMIYKEKNFSSVFPPFPPP